MRQVTVCGAVKLLTLGFGSQEEKTGALRWDQRSGWLITSRHAEASGCWVLSLMGASISPLQSKHGRRGRKNVRAGWWERVLDNIALWARYDCYIHELTVAVATYARPAQDQAHKHPIMGKGGALRPHPSTRSNRQLMVVGGGGAIFPSSVATVRSSLLKLITPTHARAGNPS